MYNEKNTPFMKITDIKKSFNGIVALHPFSLTIFPGEFHALIGENGAGKSMMINLITGVYSCDQGTIQIDGASYASMNPLLAKKHGIQAVHQELSLCNHLTVTENLFLGNEMDTKVGFLDKKFMRTQTMELLMDVGLDHIDPDTMVKNLPLAEQQLLEFARAIYRKPKLLILDEATSALNTAQVELMFNKLRELKKEGIAVIFVSHRLQELFQICDIMTVLKDGKQVVTKVMEKFDQNELVSLMTGRELVDLFPPKPDVAPYNKNVVLSFKGISNGKSRDISFDLYEGEILGIGGLQGQGQQEILETVFGILPITAGKLQQNNKDLHISSPKHAISHGMAYIPAERKSQGLLLIHSIKFNMTLSILNYISSAIGTIKNEFEKNMVCEAIERFSIKCQSMNQLISALSGGNQQKVILAKWLMTNPKLLLLNEPTRGIDVGTKREIYQLIRKLSSEGVSVMLVSSDTMELIGLCDRVVVMYENKINQILQGEQLTEAGLVHASVFRSEGGAR